jgi:hypothetical protein
MNFILYGDESGGSLLASRYLHDLVDYCLDKPGHYLIEGYAARTQFTERRYEVRSSHDRSLTLTRTK